MLLWMLLPKMPEMIEREPVVIRMLVLLEMIEGTLLLVMMMMIVVMYLLLLLRRRRRRSMLWCLLLLLLLMQLILHVPIFPGAHAAHRSHESYISQSIILIVSVSMKLLMLAVLVLMLRLWEICSSGCSAASAIACRSSKGLYTCWYTFEYEGCRRYRTVESRIISGRASVVEFFDAAVRGDPG
jgi:hypothetical protein